MNDKSSPPIHFIISAPRSGSTWLTKALNAHPQIYATEHRFFGEFCEIWPNNDGTRSPRITLDEFVKAYSVHYFFDSLGLDRKTFLDTFQIALHEAILKYAADKKERPVIVDKITPYPGTTEMVISKIRYFFPDAKILHLVRDGRDMLVSATYDWLLKDAHGTPRYQYLVQQDTSKPLDRFFDDTTVSKWSSLWTEINSKMRDKVKDVFQVRYEDMKSTMHVQLERIFEYLNVGHNADLVQYCVATSAFKKLTGRDAGNANPTAKTRKGIVGDWQTHFTRRDAELFEQLTGSALIDLGYETDSQWVRRCPETLNSGNFAGSQSTISSTGAENQN